MPDEKNLASAASPAVPAEAEKVHCVYCRAENDSKVNARCWRCNGQLPQPGDKQTGGLFPPLNRRPERPVVRVREQKPDLSLQRVGRDARRKRPK
jgi:hypothetical protein